MIRSDFTDLFGLAHPIASAPMGGVAGGHLAAAVSGAGGLGLVGGGYGHPEWLRQQLAIAADEAADLPWGVGLITWHASDDVVELVLGHRPAAVLLSFGDPAPYADRIKASGARLICQITDLDEARRAVDCGADLIVAQGTEAGGHGGRRSTMPLVPTVVDAVAPTPVLAAGGITDARGLAAAFMLGAHGAMLGTRYYASHEALGHDQAKRLLVDSSGDETQRTRVFDVVRGLTWPDSYTGRALRNAFLRRWTGHETELGDSPVERQAFNDATGSGDFDTAVVWASEGIDLIRRVESAADITTSVSTQAERLLRNGPPGMA